MTPAVIDVRAARDFDAGHRPGSGNIPLEERDRRIHELPPRGVPLIVFDVDPARAEQARQMLEARGRGPVSAATGADWLTPKTLERGPQRVRLWKPHALLEEALSPMVAAWGSVSGRRAADLACGTGRDAVFLAMHGFEVDAFDVLPDALDRAADLARRHGVSLRTHCRDLEHEPALPAGQWDLVAVFRFLHRPLLPRIRAAVRPGGFVVYETFLKEHRQRFGKPRSDAHLLAPGELAAAFDGWEFLIDRPRVQRADRITAVLVARRPP